MAEAAGEDDRGRSREESVHGFWVKIIKPRGKNDGLVCWPLDFGLPGLESLDWLFETLILVEDKYCIH